MRLRSCRISGIGYNPRPLGGPPGLEPLVNGGGLGIFESNRRSQPYRLVAALRGLSLLAAVSL